jgi:hypothetical protein
VPNILFPFFFREVTLKPGRCCLPSLCLAAITELMSPVAALDAQQDKFMDVGSQIHSTPGTMGIQKPENYPANAVHAMECSSKI